MRHNLVSKDKNFVLHADEYSFIRRVKKSRYGFIKGLIKNGIYDELEKKGLIPETTISDDGYDLTINQGRIIFADTAALHCPSLIASHAHALIDLVDFLDGYNLTLSDPHRSNFIMEAGSSKLVDLGSIDEKSDRDLTLNYLLACYVYPISLYNKKKFYQYKGCAYHYDLPDRKECFDVVFGFGPKRIFLELLHRLVTASGASLSEKLRINKLLILKLQKLCRAILLPLYKDRLKVKKLKSITMWSDYQNDSHKTDGRYLEALAMLKKLNVGQSILEIAGNQGVFSSLLADEFPGQSICCTDYDLQATEKAFNNLKIYKNVSVLWLDVFANEGRFYDGANVDRVRADTVVALALTHHLSLSQGLSFRAIFSRFREITKSILLVDFMPLGLFDGDYSPDVPNWYNQEEFITAAEENGFKFKEAKATDINRITITFKVEN